MPANATAKLSVKNLFRFIAVRGQRRMDLSASLLELDRLTSEFIQSVRQADTLEAVRKAANGHIAKSPFYQSKSLEKSRYWPWIARAQALYMIDALRPRAVEGAVTSATLAALNQARSVSTDVRANAKADEVAVWEDYLAGVISGELNADRSANLIDVLRAINVPNPITAENVKQAQLTLGASPVLPIWLINLIAPNRPQQWQFVAGVADLMLVQENWEGYLRSEIAHVENVMASETRSRNVRELNATSTTQFSSSETTNETETELQTTTRNALSSQVQDTLAQQSNLSTGVSVSARLGPAVTMNTSAGFDFSTTSSQTRSSAEEFAQDVVERSIAKLTSKQTNSTTTVVTQETEETNLHSFANVGSQAKHIVGVYRHLDQIWRAQVFNYGRRLMLDIVVPEPSVNWHAASTAEPKGARRSKPKPLDGLTVGAISPGNYQSLAEGYRVTSLPAPPDQEFHRDKVIEIPVFKKGTADSSSVEVKSATIEVPDGYEAISVEADFSGVSWKEDGKKNLARLQIDAVNLGLEASGAVSHSIGPTRGVVECGLYIDQYQGGLCSIKIKCRLTPERLNRWQQDVYDAIVNAYNKEMSAYQSDQQNEKSLTAVRQDNNSSDSKREIERAELKRASIAMLRNDNFEHNGAITFGGNAPLANLPLIEFKKAAKQGAEARFFEEAFEWPDMTYLYYPYFWARRERWFDLMAQTDSDLLFESFLKSGAARVNLSVRPGFEAAVLYYFATGQIWVDGSVPVIGDPLYVALIGEIVASKGLSIDTPEPVGDSWTYTTQTDLVVLDPDDRAITTDVSSLPQ